MSLTRFRSEVFVETFYHWFSLQVTPRKWKRAQHLSAVRITGSLFTFGWSQGACKSNSKLWPNEIPFSQSIFFVVCGLQSVSSGHYPLDTIQWTLSTELSYLLDFRRSDSRTHQALPDIFLPSFSKRKRDLQARYFSSDRYLQFRLCNSEGHLPTLIHARVPWHSQAVIHSLWPNTMIVLSAPLYLSTLSVRTPDKHFVSYRFACSNAQIFSMGLFFYQTKQPR